MEALARAASRTDLGRFQRELGDAFLLYAGRDADLRRPKREWQATLDSSGRKVGGAAPGRLSGLVVHPLRRAGDPRTATVGRVVPNDIVTPDESISLYHAAFTRKAGGRYFLQDLGSTNGTFVNDARVPHKEESRALRVKSTNTVRFGSVVMTFLLAKEVLDMSRTLAAVTASIVPAAPRLSETDLFANLAPSHTGKVPLSDALLAYFQAVEHVQNHRYQEASVLLQRLIEDDPQNTSAQIWLLLAQARRLIRGGRNTDAVEKYREILELDPHHEEALRATSEQR